MPNRRPTSTSSIFIIFAVSTIISLVILRKVDHVNEITGIVVIIGFCIALVFGIWFLIRLPSVLRGMSALLPSVVRGMSALPPSSQSVLLSSVVFLACIVFASPKVYRIQKRVYSRYSRSSAIETETRVDVMPIWCTLEVSDAKVSFIGLSYSIMLYEFAGCIAFGLIVWSLGRSKTREEQNKPNAGDG